ncbi:phytanoyl-CoA dioxygenase family protein [Halomontanus rarus]|uniref:phytanoyl-CoA dioxygenase family protein n=1 Tax=Halomontanus rarus TaxID=3034020 RepID=UPI0023E7CB45|nr:phytanoyl-CoA dioxygenase family protein [Halovivax sp. TS33]
MSLLTTAQKRSFKRNGFLVLPDGLDEGLCAEARDVLWDAIPEDRHDPESWFARDGDHDELLHRDSSSDSADRFTDVKPFEELFRDVYPYAEELVGEDLLARPDECPMEYCLHGGHLLASREDGGSAVDHEGAIGPILQYPSDLEDDGSCPFDYRRGWHIDGGTGPYAVGTDVTYLPFTIAVAVYFDDIEPRGGGFTVWPGSHRVTEEYFRTHTYAEYAADGGAVLEGLDLGPAMEIIGEAGTLVLWHHNLVHGPAPNHGERIRMAGFQRIARRDIAEISESHLGDCWLQYDAIRDLEPAVHESY